MKNNTDIFYQKAALALIEKLNVLAQTMNPEHTPYAASDFEDEAAALDLSTQDVEVPSNPSVAWKLCFLLVQKIRDARTNQEHLRQAVNDALLLQTHLKDVLDGDELSALTGLLAGDVELAAPVATETEAPAVADNETEAAVAESVVAQDTQVETPIEEASEAFDNVTIDTEDAVEQEDLDIELSEDELSQMAEGVLEAHVTLPQKEALDAEASLPVTEAEAVPSPDQMVEASHEEIANIVAGAPMEVEASEPTEAIVAEEVAALADLVLSDEDMARAEAMSAGASAEEAAAAVAAAAAEEEIEALPELDLGELTFDEADMAPSASEEAPEPAPEPAAEVLPPDVLVETEEVMASGFESFAEDDADLPAPATPEVEAIDPGILELMSETDPMMDLDLPLSEAEAPQA